MNGQKVIDAIKGYEHLPVIVRFNTDYTGGDICTDDFKVMVVDDAMVLMDDDSIYWPIEPIYSNGVQVPYRLVSAIIIDCCNDN